VTHDAEVSIGLIQVPNGSIVGFYSLDFMCDNDGAILALEDAYYGDIRVNCQGTWISIIDHLSMLAMETCGQDCTFSEFDLHQLFFASPRLSGLGDWSHVALDRDLILKWVYREFETNREGFSSIHFPPELNRSVEALSAVGPFVSVLAGHQDYVENSALLSAAAVVEASRLVREVHRHALGIQRQLETELEFPARASSRRLGEMSGELALVELELSAVESWLDIGLWVPSLRIQDFHASLVNSTQLLQRTQFTAEKVARLRNITTAWAAQIGSKEQEEAGHRRRTATLAAGLFSTVAVPLSLLLAWFGISTRDLDPKLSMFNMAHYWFVYASAFALVMIVGVLVFGYWQRGSRRLRAAHSGPPRKESSSESGGAR
jgi:hypothetical protein